MAPRVAHLGQQKNLMQPVPGLQVEADPVIGV